MRTKNQETLDRILKFVNKYYQEHHSSPTINDVAEGVGVARSTTHRYLQELSDRNLIDYGRGILSAPQSAKMKTAYVSAPLVGSIRCSNPEDEEESIEEYVSLNKSALEIDDDGTVVQTALLGLSASFARYFSGGGADPRRDMLLMTTCTLTLTDEEFTGFLTEINQTALKYMDIGVKEGSRQRQITLISSPTDGPGSR